MKLKLKEEPKEWRKAAWMSTLGLALLSSLLRWRRVLPEAAWVVVLFLLGTLAVTAALRPRWFRGHYRFSMKLGFGLSQVAGCVVLAILFFAVVTPLGLVMRLPAGRRWKLLVGSPTQDLVGPAVLGPVQKPARSGDRAYNLANFRPFPCRPRALTRHFYMSF